MNSIEVKDLVKKFGNFRALDGASMHVEKGTVYGLIGPNGAGKSTLMNHIAGIYRQEEGEVLCEGEPVFENPKAKSHMIYIPDNLYYFMQASTKEMAGFYESIYPKFNREKYEKLKEIFTGVEEKKMIRSLSKGMQKQAAFWLAISCDPDILLLDEPIDGLDPVMRKQVWNILLADVAEREMTVLISSHNLRELEDVCDHVGIMHKGKIMMEPSLSELQKNISKVQVVFKNGLPEFPKDGTVLHISNTGRIYTIIMKGNPAIVEKRISEYDPMFIDLLPLGLEEIFIYELGGEDYAVKDILF